MQKICLIWENINFLQVPFFHAKKRQIHPGNQQIFCHSKLLKRSSEQFKVEKGRQPIGFIEV